MYQPITMSGSLCISQSPCQGHYVSANHHVRGHYVSANHHVRGHYVSANHHVRVTMYQPITMSGSLCISQSPCEGSLCISLSPCQRHYLSATQDMPITT